MDLRTTYVVVTSRFRIGGGADRVVRDGEERMESRRGMRVLCESESEKRSGRGREVGGCDS
jgi:hypothetical protein